MASCVTETEMEKQNSRIVEERHLDGTIGPSTSLCNLAWKSVQKHFPNSFVDKNTESGTSSVVIAPMLNIDLTIHFSFNNKLRKKSNYVSVKVKSGKLSAVFVHELSDALEIMCCDLTDWQTLGDRVEKILQCVEFRRGKEKGMKKKKGGKKVLVNKTCAKKKDDDDDGGACSFPEPELYFNINALPKREEKTLRPNYFIAVRIHDPDIRNSISNLQECLVNQETLFTKGVIGPEALHMTLCNLGLDTADDLLVAMEAMKEMKPELEKILPTSSFVVQGVSQFYNRAIYAKVTTSEEVVLFRNVLRQNLEKAGVKFREDHEEFTPHVTVVKVRRPERRAFGTENIQSSLYANYVDFVFGKQAVDALYLCAMGGQKRDDGFYTTACEIHFTSDRN